LRHRHACCCCTGTQTAIPGFVASWSILQVTSPRHGIGKKDGTINGGRPSCGEGESWPHGRWSWRGMCVAGAVELNKGRNLVSMNRPQLDEEDGVADGAPLLSGSNLWQIHNRYQGMAKVLSDEFQQLRRAAGDDGRRCWTRMALKILRVFLPWPRNVFSRSPTDCRKGTRVVCRIEGIYRQDPLLYGPAHLNKMKFQRSPQSPSGKWQRGCSIHVRRWSGCCASIQAASSGQFPNASTLAREIEVATKTFTATSSSCATARPAGGI